MGVLTVEDGSIDTENLEDDGLSPGKILVYRQGATPPRFMNFDRVPVDFAAEENMLLNEFTYISGVSDLLRNSLSTYSKMSGVALQVLVEQDDTRISITAEKFVKRLRRWRNTFCVYIVNLQPFLVFQKLLATTGKLKFSTLTRLTFQATILFLKQQAKLAKQLRKTQYGFRSS